MSIQFDIEHRILHFKQPAGTSRGVYTTRPIWLIRLWHDHAPEIVGWGECAPLPDLSCDFSDDYAQRVQWACELFAARGDVPVQELRRYPSILFGLESAAQWLQAGSSRLFDTPFSRSQAGIPINGLVWMGSHEQMLERMQEKLEAGFRCVKLKIGAIDFDDELDLMSRLRERFPADKVELRLDANGAFSAYEALDKLEQLARYDIHSIEQPIRQGQWQQMAMLCKYSPIPIALDEELIGVNDLGGKCRLLDAVQPKYLVLKPSLHGGMSGVQEWISLARERAIGSWITSALESNIGLNSIAQLTAKIYGPDIALPQGLGTGQLFEDNIPMPLQIIGDSLWNK